MGLDQMMMTGDHGPTNYTLFKNLVGCMRWVYVCDFISLCVYVENSAYMYDIITHTEIHFYLTVYVCVLVQYYEY